MKKKEKSCLPKRRIVCLRGVENKGKSEAIKALAVNLLKNSNAKVVCHKPDDWEGKYKAKDFLNLLKDINERPKNDRDITITIIQTGNKCIGLKSDGDYFGDIDEYLPKLVEDNCAIIFCASRSKLATVKAVKKIVKKYHYTIIWTAPYTDDTPPQKKPTSFQDDLNKLKAGHLMAFI